MESYRSSSRGAQERRQNRDRDREMQWGRRADYERYEPDPFEGPESGEESEMDDRFSMDRGRSSDRHASGRDRSRSDRGFETFEDWQRRREYERSDSPAYRGSSSGYSRWNPRTRSYGIERFGTRQPFGSGRFSSEWEQPEHTGAFGSHGYGSQEFESHAGKGPKGYQRSDERIREELSDRLTADPEIDASDITVSIRQGEVTLEGTVSQRGMKRAAEDLADEISGVRQVNNRLRVEDQRASGRASGGTDQPALPAQGPKRAE
jgi:hypothetical protein